jgi:hypothetical protein
MKFDGQLTWVSRSSSARVTSDITNGVVSLSALRFDVVAPPGRYVVELPTGRRGSFSRGGWTCGRRSGSCGGRVFDADGDLFIAFGEWLEDGEIYDWWAELSRCEEEAS